MNYWHNQHVTGIVGVNLPDERNSGSGGSFQAVEASARALPSDGHLVVQANGTVSAIPDYPTLVKCAATHLAICLLDIGFAF